MQITHDQAHRLIQLSMDKLLGLPEKALLSAHLQGCQECQVYASQMRQVESTLRPLLKRQWNAVPIPLRLDGLLRVRTLELNTRALLTTRITAAGLLVMTLLFSVWQFMASGPSASRPGSVSVPPIPTPSALTAQSTRTKISFEACQRLIYTVRQTDRLEDLAVRFSVSEGILRAANDLKGTRLTAGMELMIPICKSTPTGTFDPLTTTFTPALSPPSTPGG